MKWGEYSSEVQLILRRSTPENSKTLSSLGSRLTHGPRSNGIVNSASEHATITNSGQDDTKGITTVPNTEFDDIQGCLDRNRDTRKSLTFGGLHGNVMENNTEVTFRFYYFQKLIGRNILCHILYYYRFRWKMLP